MLQYIRHYRIFLLLSVLCAAVSVALTLYSPILIGAAVDQVLGPGQVNFPAVGGILVRMGIVTVIAGAAQWLMNICNNKISYHVIRDMRQDAFRKIQVLPFGYIDSHPYGEVVSRVIADVDQFSDGLLMGFTQLFTGVLTILGTLVFMFSISPLITVAVIVLTPLSFVVAGFIASRTYSMFRKQSETRGEQTALIDEMIGNQKVVRAFGYEEESQQRFDEINDRLRGLLPESHLLFIPHQPLHPLCQFPGVCGGGDLRRGNGYRRRNLRRTAGFLLKLCQPVYKTLQ